MKRNSSTRSCFEPSILELVCGTAGKPQTLTEASFVTVLIQIWPTLLLIQTSTNVPGKAQYGTNTWVPTTHMEDPDGVPGSQLQKWKGYYLYKS